MCVSSIYVKLTWHEPIPEANHVGRPKPEAARVRLLVVVFPVAIPVEARLPQADVLELVARRRIRLRPIGSRKGDQRAQARPKDEYARDQILDAEVSLAYLNHSSSTPTATFFSCVCACKSACSRSCSCSVSPPLLFECVCICFVNVNLKIKDS